MRTAIKLLIKFFFGFMTIMIGAFSIAPATQGEARLLGGDPERIELVQMRLANVLLDHTPEYVVAKFADAAGVPLEQAQENLEYVAQGQFPDAVRVETETTTRRIRAGGALFVSAD